MFYFYKVDLTFLLCYMQRLWDNFIQQGFHTSAEVQQFSKDSETGSESHVTLHTLVIKTAQSIDKSSIYLFAHFLQPLIHPYQDKVWSGFCFTEPFSSFAVTIFKHFV